MADEAEEAVFDFVPFARARREVSDSNLESGLVREALEFVLPEAYAWVVASSTIGGERECLCVGIRAFSDGVPPSADTLNGEFCSVAVDAEVDPASIVIDVIDAVWDDFAEFGNFKVVGADFFGLSFRAPFAPVVLEISDEFFLLGVDADDGFFLLLLCSHVVVDIFELCIAVGVVCSFSCLFVGLQAVPVFAK